MSFPTPIGGTSLPADFAPSILFAVLYALLVPFMFYRLIYDKRSRTTLLIGAVTFGVERVVIFSLRAVQSHNENKRLSKGLLTYMQISFGMGFIGIANDLVNIVRVYLVNPSYGSEKYDQSPASRPLFHPEDVVPRYRAGEFAGEPPTGTPDHRRQRFWSRRFSDFTHLAFYAAIVPGIIANSRFSSVLDSSDEANRTMRLRYVSCGVALFLTFILSVATVWARFKLARVSRKGTLVILTLALLLSTITLYRLSVMFHTTTSLSSKAPGSLNSPGAKASFYILHVLPEWLSTAILFIFPIRRIYATGPFGDWRFRDETPKERKQREKRDAKRAERRKQKLNRVTGDAGHSVNLNTLQASAK